MSCTLYVLHSYVLHSLCLAYDGWRDTTLYVLLGVSHIQSCDSRLTFSDATLHVLLHPFKTVCVNVLPHTCCSTHLPHTCCSSCLTHVAPHIYGCKCLSYYILLLTLLAASAYVLLHTCCSARSWLPVLTVVCLTHT